MCTEALVNGEWCNNVGELEKALGGPCVYGGQKEDRGCLCPVDWEATADAHNLIVRMGRNELAGAIVMHAKRKVPN